LAGAVFVFAANCHCRVQTNYSEQRKTVWLYALSSDPRLLNSKWSKLNIAEGRLY
jgi:hypothetical protein